MTANDASMFEERTVKRGLAVLFALVIVSVGVTGPTIAESSDVGYSSFKRIGWDTHEGELWGAAIGCIGGGIAAGLSSFGIGAAAGCAGGGALGAA